MQYQLKNTGSYLVILGEKYKSEILPYYVAGKLTTGEFDIFRIDTPNDIDSESQYQILAHLPLKEAPVLDGIDMLPSLSSHRDNLLASMAMRYRHDFYLLEKAHQDSILTQMSQLLEEVIGKGFYKGETYLYTERMAREIWDAGKEYERTSGDSITYEELTEKIKNPNRMPIAFEAKMERLRKMQIKGRNMELSSGEYKPLIRKNTKGVIEWIGDYIF